MNQDINIKKVRLNCYRQSKVPGEFMLQMRVPGGTVDAKYLSYVEHIAKTWGDGNFHFGTRQTFDITGISYENIPAVNDYLKHISRKWMPSSAMWTWTPFLMNLIPGIPKQVTRRSAPEISPPVSATITAFAATPILLNWHGR